MSAAQVELRIKQVSDLQRITGFTNPILLDIPDALRKQHEQLRTNNRVIAPDGYRDDPQSPHL